MKDKDGFEGIVKIIEFTKAQEAKEEIRLRRFFYKAFQDEAVKFFYENFHNKFENGYFYNMQTNKSLNDMFSVVTSIDNIPDFKIFLMGACFCQLFLDSEKLDECFKFCGWDIDKDADGTQFVDDLIKKIAIKGAEELEKRDDNE